MQECYPVLSLHGLKYANSCLVPVSFWMLTMPWIFNPISFNRRVSRCVASQTKVAHLCFCLVRIKMSLLICSKTPRFSQVSSAHMLKIPGLLRFPAHTCSKGFPGLPVRTHTHAPKSRSFLGFQCTHAPRYQVFLELPVHTC